MVICAAGWGRIFTTGLTIMELHFYKLLEWGCTFSGFWGSENSGMKGFKNRKIYSTLSLTNVSVHFRVTKLKGFIR